MNLLYEMVLHEVFIVGFVVGLLSGFAASAVFMVWDSRRRR